MPFHLNFWHSHHILKQYQRTCTVPVYRVQYPREVNFAGSVIELLDNLKIIRINIFSQTLILATVIFQGVKSLEFSPANTFLEYMKNVELKFQYSIFTNHNNIIPGCHTACEPTYCALTQVHGYLSSAWCILGVCQCQGKSEALYIIEEVFFYHHEATSHLK